MQDLLLAILNLSELNSLTNNAKIRSSVKFLLIRYVMIKTSQIMGLAIFFNFLIFTNLASHVITTCRNFSPIPNIPLLIAIIFLNNDKMRKNGD